MKRNISLIAATALILACLASYLSGQVPAQKQQQNRLDALETRLQSLEAQISHLESRVKTLENPPAKIMRVR